MFEQVFFRDYFPNSTREQMTSEWINLKQGSKTVDEYKLEFSCLLHFVGQGYRDNERMKIQKFKNELNLKIRHDVKMFELTTLTAFIHKARLVERNKLECRK